MPVEQIPVEQFLKLSFENPLLDVRSPAEFSHAHFPGSISVPIFTNEQRAVIGTAYVQESRAIAVNYGLNFFSERMKIIPKEVNEIVNDWQKEKGKTPAAILIHCWRGGMRSEAVAWLLNLFGYKVYVLKGGYKAFRRWSMAQFEKTYSLRILGGYTGSGKSEVLKELGKKGKNIIDLENLASHKGSAFGGLGQNPQPSHEMFENLLAIELWKTGNKCCNGNEQTKTIDSEIWLEDESVHIGAVGIPKIFWQQMRESPLFFLDIPFHERVKHIVTTYGKFEKEKLIECILKIQKRLGGLNTKNAISFLNNGELNSAFSILLKYYDKMYGESLQNREQLHLLMKKISCPTTNAENSASLIDQEHFTFTTL